MVAPEVERSVRLPQQRQRSEHRERGAVTAGPVDLRAHARDAGHRIGGVVTPRDPAAPEAGEASRDARVAPPAHPDRHAAGLHRLGHRVDRLEAQLRRREGRALLAPERLADLERVVEQAAARAEVETGRFVLLALPADADAEVDATVREDVEGGQLLGEHDRPPQRREQDVGAESNPIRLRRDRGERR